MLNHEGKAIGLKDRNGTEIRVNDLVEFYFCADCGSGARPEEVCECPPTRMVDHVHEEDGEFFFMCPGAGGAFAWRYNAVCRVIGWLPKDAKMYAAANKGILTE